MAIKGSIWMRRIALEQSFLQANWSSCWAVSSSEAGGFCVLQLAWEGELNGSKQKQMCCMKSVDSSEPDEAAVLPGSIPCGRIHQLPSWPSKPMLLPHRLDQVQLLELLPKLAATIPKANRAALKALQKRCEPVFAEIVGLGVCTTVRARSGPKIDKEKGGALHTLPVHHIHCQCPFAFRCSHAHLQHEVPCLFAVCKGST